MAKKFIISPSISGNSLTLLRKEWRKDHEILIPMLLDSKGGMVGKNFRSAHLRAVKETIEFRQIVREVLSKDDIRLTV